MSQTNDQGSTSHGRPHDMPLPANYGVRLREAGGAFAVVPQKAGGDDREHPPFPMPRVPGRLVDRACDFLHRLWVLRHACAMCCLYLDVNRHAWDLWLPPQTCGRDAARADLAFTGVEAPRADLRLAGSLFSCPHANRDQVAPLLPAFPGVHVVRHVTGGRRDLSAYLCPGRGGEHLMWSEELAVAREPDPGLDHLLERLRFVDAL